MAATGTTSSELLIDIDNIIRSKTQPNSITPETHSDLLDNMVQVLSADTYVNSGSFNQTGGTITFSNNSGGGFSVSGITSNGSSYEIIDTVTYNDFNSYSGTSNFTATTTTPYPTGKILDGIMIHANPVLDVDTSFSVTTQDVTNQTTGNGISLSSNEGKIQFGVDGLIQTDGGSFILLFQYGGKGSFVGGNTVGNYDIYAKYINYQ